MPAARAGAAGMVWPGPGYARAPGTRGVDARKSGGHEQLPWQRLWLSPGTHTRTQSPPGGVRLVMLPTCGQAAAGSRAQSFERVRPSAWLLGCPGCAGSRLRGCRQVVHAVGRPAAEPGSRQSMRASYGRAGRCAAQGILWESRVAAPRGCGGAVRAAHTRHVANAV